jgi:DNA replication protein DnaC
VNHISDVMNGMAKEGSLKWLATHPDELERRMAEAGMVKRDTRAAKAELCQYGCGGAGWMRYDVPVGHPLFGKGKACLCAQEKAQLSDEQRIEQYRQQLSRTEQHWTLKNWIGSDENARARAKAAIEHPFGLKTFVGPYGTGKSGLLAAIINSALDKKIPAQYWVVNDLLNKLRASYDPKDLSSFDRAVNEICSVRVLALDELSAYKPSEWTDQTLRTIIDERYRHWDRLLTVMGANELPQHDAIVSRLNDSLRSEIVYMKGADMRSMAKELTPDDTYDGWLLEEADVLAQEADQRFVTA